jgi:hypothetical protein
MIRTSPGDLKMPIPPRPASVLSPAGLALASVVLLGAGLAQAQSAAPAPLTEKALLADFVEVSSRQALRRDAALIELVNMSDIILDVHIGEGGTSLKPGERMLAGVQPGRVAVKVIGQDAPTGALEGDLEIEGGRHYELAFAYDVPRAAPPEAEAEAAPAATGEAAAPPAGEAAALKATPAPGTRPAKPGKVQIGRKRR